ncbi:putative repeat protein (TIGR01451 family)/gliding motility-associated-like protein [Balneicella halophila]|uniref:Putative repeat protein (TIGR01451 family)/gliding motility-associated-like protein n=1 Tax=Balneicella halophila TaxID=1537566 RepID=A0A7L4USK4_BALHA|nr:gliding motility-associated C-terminal domain-containing protein [Balneicella halophila]PVX52421.1 putative repeat protein (TIGR01451 family)/gliding motility-associated-like protein [Balneicella halophila]
MRLKSIFLKCILLFSLAVCLAIQTNGQATLSLSPANLEISNGSTELETIVTMTDLSEGFSTATVTISFPTGIAYKSGSLSLVSTNANLQIVESDVSDPQNPVFLITKTGSPATFTIADRIGFKVSRYAGCEANDNISSVFQDEVKVQIGSNIVDKLSDEYNLIAPSIVLSPVSDISASYGQVYQREMTILNAGLGGTRNVYFTTDEPGIYNQTSISAVLHSSDGTTSTISLGTPSSSGLQDLYTINGSNLGSDNSFTNNEKIVITESFNVAECGTAPIETQYSAGWGDGPTSLCQSSDRSAKVTVKDIKPSVRAISHSPELTGNSICSNLAYKTLTVTWKNTSAVANVATAIQNINFLMRAYGTNTEYIYDSDYSEYYDYKLITPNGGQASVPLSQATAPAANGQNRLEITLEDAFNSDVDGPGGLEDIDGDGNYDDLPAGEEITIEFKLRLHPELLSCSNPTIRARPYTWITYNTECTTSTQSAGLWLQNHFRREISTSANGYIPVNTFPGEPFETALSANLVTRIDTEASADSRLQYVITLPAGFDGSDIKLIEGRYPARGATLSSTITTTTDPTSGETTIVVTSVDYVEELHVVMDVTKDCSNPNVNDDEDINIKYDLNYITNINYPNCIEKISCDNIFTTKMESCPDPNEGPCYGASTLGVRVQRADNSLGWTDESMTTRQSRANISILQQKRALYLDDIEVLASGRQRTETINLYQELAVKLDNSNGNPLTPKSIDITFTRAGNTYNATLDASTTPNNVEVVQNSGNQVITWDLSSAISSSGIPGGNLQEGDTYITVATYQVTSKNLKLTDINYGEHFYFYNISDTGNKMICGYDDLIPEMYLMHTANNVGSKVWRIYSCDPKALGENGLSMANRFDTGGIEFVDEFRPAFQLDEFVITIPADVDMDRVEYLPTKPKPNGVGVDDNNAHKITLTTSDANATNQTTVNGITYNSYTFKNSSDRFKPGSVTVKNNVAGHIIPYLSASCDATTKANIDIAVKVKDYYYHYADPTTPSGTALKEPRYNSSGVNNKNVTVVKPVLTLTNLSGTLDVTQAEEHFNIRLRVTNANAQFTYLYVPNEPDVEITRMEDNSGNVISSTITNDGVIFDLRTTHNKNASHEYKLFFKYTTCEEKNFKISTGWGCDGFPTDASDFCDNNKETTLTFRSRPNLIQLNKIISPSSIDLCTDAQYKFIVNSAQEASVLSPTLTINLKAGMTINNFEVEYPLNSNNFYPVNPASGSTSMEKIYDLFSYSNAPNFLPGTTDANGNSNNRQIGVRYNIATDCEYISGTSYKLSIEGISTCGEPANGNNIVTNNAYISGAESKYSIIKTFEYVEGDLTTCSNNMGAKFRGQHTIIADNNIVTGNNGFIIIRLPENYSYVPNSFVEETTTGATISSTITDPTTGITTISINIPENLGNADVIRYTINIIEDTDEFVECGAKLIEVYSVDEIEGLECSTAPNGKCDKLTVQTSLTTEIEIVTEKPTVEIIAGSFISAHGDGLSNTLSVDFDIKNTSLIDLSHDLTVKVYNDINSSGSVDAGDQELLSKDINFVAAAGESISSSIVFEDVNPIKICNLLLVISRDDNICICEGDVRPISLESNTMIDGIAGEDITVCEDDITHLVGSVLNEEFTTYQWSSTTTGATDYLSSTTVATPTFEYSGAPLTNQTSITYQVRVTQEQGCSFIDEVVVTILPLPREPAITPNTPICAYEDAVFTVSGTQSDVLTYETTTGGLQSLTFSSSGIATITSVAISDDEILTLVSLQSGLTSCTSELSGSSTVTVNELPEISGPTYVYKGNTVTLTATTSPSTTDAWSISPTATVASIVANGSTLNVTGVNTGTSVVTYTNALGCIATHTLEVRINPIDAVDDDYTGDPINGADGGTTSSVLENDTLNGVEVNPNDVNLTPGTAPTPTDGSITMNDDGTITVAPGTTAGTYTMTYTICEKLNPDNCDTATATILVEPPVIDAVDDDYTGDPINGSDGGTTSSVLENETLNGDPVDPDDVNLTPGTAPTPTDGSITMNDDGTITVAPGTTAGTYTMTYTICEKLNPDNCDTATATILVEPPVIDAVDDDYTSTPIDGIEGGTLGNILDNDTLNGVLLDPNDINLIPGFNPQPDEGSITMNADGTITVAPGTTGGIYVMNYTICEKLNPANCDTAVITVVVKSPEINAADDDYSSTPIQSEAGGELGNVLDNDTLNGAVVNPDEIYLTPGLNPAPSEGSIVMNPDGTLSVSPNTTPGVYTMTYTICEKVNPENCDSAIVTIKVEANSSITLDKQGVFQDENSDGNAQAGETVIYTFTVKNTGSVALSNVHVDDSRIGVTDLATTPSDLEAGEKGTVSYSYTLTAEDVKAGEVLNVAYVEGTTSLGDTVTSSDSATVEFNTVEENGEVSVEKTADKEMYEEVGEDITYTIVVKNTGNVVLTNVVVSDPLTGLEKVVEELDVAASVSFTTEYTVTQSDIDTGFVNNVVTAEGITPLGSNVSDTDTATVKYDSAGGEENGEVSVEKTADKEMYEEVGEVITYSIVVKNTGNVVLTNVVVSDPLTGLERVVEELVVDASLNFTTEYTVTQSDIDTGFVNNVVRAEGTTLLGSSVSDTDTATVKYDSVGGEKNGEITVEKTADRESYEGVGEEITYTIVLKNTGNVLLTNVNVKDPLTGLNETVSELAVGESIEFTVYYIATREDITNKSIVNIVFAEGELPDGTKVDDETDAVVVFECPGFDDNFKIPQVITPNNDGHNDTWEVAELELRAMCSDEVNNVMIFNRWGAKVYEKRNYMSDSDRFSGYSTNSLDFQDDELLPAGVYFYVIELNDKIEKTGYIYLLSEE